MSRNQIIKLLINNGALLALLTLLAYVLSYVYNMGYGDYFAVPKDLVSFSLSGLFSSLTTLAAGLLIVSVVLNSITTEKLENHTITTLIANFVYLLVFWLTAWIVEMPKIIHYYIAAYMGLFVFVHIVLPYIGKNKHGGYLESVENSIDQHLGDAKTLTDHFLNLIYKHYFRYVLLVFGAIMVAYGVGGYIAKHQKNYFILNGQKNWVVVRFVDDKVVLAERKRSQLTGRILVENVIDTKGTVIREIATGKLKRHE